jgi:hypothetical protein
MAIFLLILALGAAIAAFILIVPENKGRQLTGFMRVLHDILNFKQLLMEKILKFCYIFFTVYAVLAGLFSSFEMFEWDAGTGLLTMLASLTLVPLLIRVIFEMSMMVILLVKNVIDINKKLPGGTKEPEPAQPAYQPNPTSYQPNPASYQNPYQAAQPTYQPAQPTYQQPAQPAYQPNYRYCTHCGAYYDANAGRCPNCGNQ